MEVLGNAVRRALDMSTNSAPAQAVEAVTRELAAALGATAVALLIADLSGRALVRLTEASLLGSGDTPVDGGFLSEQPARQTFESVFARLVATAGIVGIGTALGAILTAANVAGWISGLVISIVTVALAAMLWRSRRL